MAHLPQKNPSSICGLKGCTQFAWPLVAIADPRPYAGLRQITKAGLLAYPPSRQPSHPDESKQWHPVAKRVLFSSR